jgi:DNA-binding NarL/FixJ family response regulator
VQTARSPAPAVQGSSSHAIRVLCVDDHAVLVEGLKAQFAIAGAIEVVGRLSTAARLVEEAQRLNPHIVLLDIEMPGPDAFEMADRLKRVLPKVRVMFLSAHIRDAFIAASFSAGACAYFAKSDDLDEIVRGIREVMSKPKGTFIMGPKVSARCVPAALTSRRGVAGDMSAEDGSGPRTLLKSLTPRESDILRLIGAGLSRNQIAEQLCRSVKTIDGHQDRMMKKLAIRSRAGLMRFAIREGVAQA